MKRKSNPLQYLLLSPILLPLLIFAIALPPFATTGCSDEEEGEEEEEEIVYPPLTIGQELRAIAYDLQDGPTITGRQSQQVPIGTLNDSFPAIILRRQFHDEFSAKQGLPGPHDFHSAITTLRDEVESHLGTGQSYDVHLDLQTLSRVDVSGPSSQVRYNFATRVNGDETQFRLDMVDAVSRVASELTPRRFVIGTHMNLYKNSTSGEDDWHNFVDFYREKMRPAVKSSSPQTMVSVGIFWDQFIIDSDRHALPLVEESQARVDDPETYPDEELLTMNEAREITDQQLFDEMFGDILSHMDELALVSRPINSQLGTLEDNHYRRLLPLLPPGMPVAFISLSSPHVSTGDDELPAVSFMKKFRDLAGGLNVSQVAWTRAMDVINSSRCQTLMENNSVPRELRFCHAGLLRSDGRLKAQVWEEYMDDREQVVE